MIDRSDDQSRQVRFGAYIVIGNDQVRRRNIDQGRELRYRFAIERKGQTVGIPSACIAQKEQRR